MKPRRIKLRPCLLSIALGIAGSGCGAMFNGMVQTIEVETEDPNARILRDGAVIGTGSVMVDGSPANPPVLMIEDSRGNVVRYVPESKVSTAAVVLDGLWCLTIIGVAAPISDALLGTFSGLVGPSGPIAVPPSPPRQRSIEYGTNGTVPAATSVLPVPQLLQVATTPSAAADAPATAGPGTVEKVAPAAGAPKPPATPTKP